MAGLEQLWQPILACRKASKQLCECDGVNGDIPLRQAACGNDRQLEVSRMILDRGAAEDVNKFNENAMASLHRAVGRPSSRRVPAGLRFRHHLRGGARDDRARVGRHWGSQHSFGCSISCGV